MTKRSRGGIVDQETHGGGGLQSLSCKQCKACQARRRACDVMKETEGAEAPLAGVPAKH